VRNPALAFRKSIKNIPFLAAQTRTSAAAVNAKFSPAHKYSAAVLAVAATAVAIAPLTASADSSHAKAAAKPAAVSTAKPAAKAPAAKSTTEAAKPAAPQAKVAAPQAAAAPKAQAAKPAAPQAKAAAPKAAAPAKAYAGTSMASLEPTGTVGYQSHYTLTSAEWQNATTIVNAAHDLGLSPYAATIAVATAMQESKLQNLTVAVDHDSLGLFQQRPSTGWGSPSQLENPTYAAKAFLKSLPSGYQHMSLHTVAQNVQRSFDGYLYAQWEDEAAQIVHTIAS
jgi:hypothetical protein